MIPEDLKYSKDHEWVRVANGVATIGITEFAQKQLGDIVYVETPKLGEVLSQNDSFGTIESVKAVSELYSPLSGELVVINQEVVDSPELVNEDPYGDGWIIQVRPSNLSELENLLSAQEYDKMISSGE
jgi:glycine cleavage system H protein